MIFDWPCFQAFVTLSYKSIFVILTTILNLWLILGRENIIRVLGFGGFQEKIDWEFRVVKQFEEPRKWSDYTAGKNKC